MRLNECQQVKETLSKHLGINLTVADASEKFLSRLSGVVEPEKKRKIIGSTFIDIFEEEAVRIEKSAENTSNAGRIEWFLQGTLYPVRRPLATTSLPGSVLMNASQDVIESISFKGPSATIKVSGSQSHAIGIRADRTAQDPSQCWRTTAADDGWPRTEAHRGTLQRCLRQSVAVANIQAIAAEGTVQRVSYISDASPVHPVLVG